jgi:membrane protease YdiL (CAAX protease family)
MVFCMTSLRIWLPALAGPLIVTVGLLGLHSAPFVFLFYHAILCLLVPALVAIREGRSLAAHLRELGLVRRGLQASLALGLVSALAPPAAYMLLPQAFPDTARLQAALGDWGLATTAPGSFLFFMAVVNGPAEELFWRGWLLRSPATGRGAKVLLAMLFTSYHAVTIGRLAPSTGAAALLVAGVFGAAMFWTWTRVRWQSVWPALLSHTGATCGYLFICAQLLDRG